MKALTLEEIDMFRRRAKTELKSGSDCSRLRWDDVVEALCKEVIRLKIQCKEILTSGYVHFETPVASEPKIEEASPLTPIHVWPHMPLTKYYKESVSSLSAQ